VHVSDLSGWLADSGISAGARLGLRVEAWHRPARTWEPADTQEPQDPEDPENAEPGFRVVLQLRSSADPSLIVDAATLWDQPQSVLSRFGTRAETDLLLALRRGTAVWPPLGVALGQVRPAGFEIDDEAIADLLGWAAEELAGAGIEVLWPNFLLDDDLKATAVPMQAPGQVTDAGLNLQALLSFRWRLTLGGEELDETEVAELAEAKRPLVRIRGRWVTLNPKGRSSFRLLSWARSATYSSHASGRTPRSPSSSHSAATASTLPRSRKGDISRITELVEQ
jgi:hypothetical protein